LTNNTISKSKMILRRQGGGDEAYYTYVEEADDAANKNSALIYNWYNILDVHVIYTNFAVCYHGCIDFLGYEIWQF